MWSRPISRWWVFKLSNSRLKTKKDDARHFQMLGYENIHIFSLKLFSFSNLKLNCSGLYSLEIWINFIKVLVISYTVKLSKVVFCGIVSTYSTLWKKSWRNDSSAGYFFLFLFARHVSLSYSLFSTHALYRCFPRTVYPLPFNQYKGQHYTYEIGGTVFKHVLRESEGKPSVISKASVSW